MSVNKSIQYLLKRSKAKEVLFSLTCLLLPMNLFRIWRPAWAYLDGIFIDYWAPSLHASSLTIWLLWLLFLWEMYQKGSSLNFWEKIRASVMAHFRLFLKRPRYLIVTIILTILLLGRPLTSSNPFPAWFFLLETISGPFLFLLYLRTERAFCAHHLRSALLVAVSLQVFLSWYQFFLQNPLGPYWLLGEPRFGAEFFLAASQVSSTVRSLPYGSTPHPNVLAGWMLIGILTAVSGKMKKSHLFLLMTFFSTLLMTESLTALASLPILLGAFVSRKRLQKLVQIYSNTSLGRLLPLITAILGGLAWQMLIVCWATFQAFPSITRRSALFLTAVQHWPEWWLTGTGVLGHLNLTKLAFISSFQGRFLQPIHSVPLILTIDLGIGGILLLFAFSIFGYKYYSYILWLMIGILPIFTLDHFGVTTMSGQFILLIIPLFFSKYLRNYSPLKK